MVLSYTGKVLAGTVPYNLPPMPFVPGTNAIGRVAAAGDNVNHVRVGDTINVNGATGYFGSGAVMLAIAMGAGRVVAVGRNAAALEALRAALGPRVVLVPVTGDADKDLALIRSAAGGAADVALDLLG